MTNAEFQAQITELQLRLEEAETTLEAIRNGEVDAVVVSDERIYTLQGADHPYRVLVEAMQQGAVTVSTDGTIMYSNEAFARMIRRPAERIVGDSITSIFIPSDRFFFTEHIQRDPAAAPAQAELRLKADDGTSLPVLVSFTLLTLETVSALCLVITDLTEHKQNEKLLATDRRKDEFLAMLAHELRNPLAPISNAAQMLFAWNNGKNKEVDYACEVVERQVRQMTRIVDDLLDVSRITRGKIKLQKQRTNVSAIVSAAVETSRPLIEARKHQLYLTVTPEELAVDADITRMAQVVTNLLNNAAKYTDDGGQIAVTVERDADDVLIRVTDNGMGMSEQMLTTVFDLFTQADRTIDRSQGGLGIGLTLVRSLVELHRGTVSAASAGPGKGSEFLVRLPLAAVETNRAATNGASAEVHAVPLKQRILVVDDNKDSAMTLALMLKAMGHDAIVAYDGQFAIEQNKSFKPSLILLDIGLPGMNGYMVAEQLRREGTDSQLRLAALTGYSEEHDRKRSIEAGFDHYFVKPVDIDALQKLIASLPQRQWNRKC